MTNKYLPLCILLAATQTLAQTLSGTILSPAFRSTVGPATKAACGEGIAEFIAANPTADLLTVANHQDGGYNVAACNLNLCGGYQFADSPASAIHTVTPSQVINITASFVTPSAPLDSRDYYELYTHTLTIANATNGYALWGILDNAITASPQVLTHPSINQLDAIGLGDFPAGACSQPGQCYLSWEFVDFFRQPTLVSSRNIYAKCLDIVIDWSK